MNDGAGGPEASILSLSMLLLPVNGVSRIPIRDLSLGEGPDAVGPSGARRTVLGRIACLDA